MAKSQGQPTFALTAGATFSNSDLYKFVRVNSSGHAVITGTTNSLNVVGTLLSETGTTSAAGVEAVTIGALVGKGSVRLAASTAAAGNTVGASSVGYGVAPSTDALQLGTIVAGTSGAAGRIATVVFGVATA